jgi:Asp/Glu/hydantoin racemase
VTSPPASSSARPLIALISATPAAIPPARKAFHDNYPDAELLNILDDGLQEQANRAGGLTPHLTERMKRLINHAVLEGADGVLLTCSMYSSVAQLVAGDLAVPILGPDDAAFAIATAGDYRSILVLASLPAALADVQTRLTAARGRLDTALQIRGAVAEGAFAAVQADDHAALLAALSDTATANGAAEVDAILLAQYSLTPVADQLQVQLGIPVLSGPTLAAQTLRDAITGEAARA